MTVYYRAPVRRVAYRVPRRYRRRSAIDLRLAGAAIVAVVAVAGVLGHHGHHHPARHGHAAVAVAASAPACARPGNEALAECMAAARGWIGPQWGCLDNLWTRESAGTWNPKVTNPKSGALGIAQALGHGPTNQYPAGPANGPVFSASAQIRWGLSYIAGRYVTPCVAWAHETSAGWY